MHCEACGRPGDVCAGCRRDLDPPRFCRACGRKLRVQVRPVGYVARCYEHGEVGDDGHPATPSRPGERRTPAD